MKNIKIEKFVIDLSENISISGYAIIKNGECIHCCSSLIEANKFLKKK